MALGYSLFFLAVVYEFLYIDEDFLFIISFFIFFVNVVNITSEFLYTELTVRRNQLADILKFNVLLNKYTVNFNYEIFDFFHNFDLEVDFNKILFVTTNANQDLNELSIDNTLLNVDDDVIELLLAEDEDLINAELNLLELADEVEE